MAEFYFSTNLTNEKMLCISTLTDRKAAAAGADLDLPIGYYLYETSCSDDADEISVIAKVVSEDAVLRLRLLLGME